MINLIRKLANNSPILVTGGAGFIGSHLVEYLVQNGARVTVLDNSRTGNLANLCTVRPNIELIQGSLTNLLASEEIIVSDYSYIFHLAANPYIPPSVEDPSMDFQANLMTTFALLEALRKAERAPRLVNTSSAAVYGNPLSLPIKESDPTVPISPYGVSKLAAERYVAIYSQLYGLQTTSLRLFSIYGPRQRKQVVYDLLHKLRVNPYCLEIIGDGSQARDFTFVGDVVQAMILAAIAAPGQGEAYNVAAGVTYTIAELAHAWCEVCNLEPEITYTGQIRPGDAEKWVVDITQICQLGYKPQTSLATNLIAIRDWYDECHN